MKITPQGSGNIPTAEYRPGFFVRNGYRMAETVLTAPQHLEGFLQRRLFVETAGQKLSLWKRASNALLRTTGYFGKLVTDFDSRAFHSLEIPGKLSKLGKYLICEPPMGTLVMTMMFFNIPARMARAVERDPTSREMWDVMRRDITGITILLFALGPLVTHLSRFIQNYTGIKLVEEEAGALGKSFRRFSYDQCHRNYTLTSAKTLEAVVRDKINHPGLLKAAKGLSDGGLSKKHNSHELKGLMEALNKTLPELVNAKEDHLITALSEKAYGLIARMDQFRQQAVESTGKGADAHIAQLTQNLPKFSEFLSRYAMTRRLMVDVFSLLLCIVGIGWFPVWFNDVWSRKKHAEKMAKLEATQAPLQPQAVQPLDMPSPPAQWSASAPSAGIPHQSLPAPAPPAPFAWSRNVAANAGFAPAIQYNSGKPLAVFFGPFHGCLLKA